MTENDFNNYSSIQKESIKTFTELHSNIDKIITTDSGVTVIPVSKVTMGYLSGGVGFKNEKNMSDKTTGGGGGTGISVTPVAFLTVGYSGDINLISLNESAGLEKVVNLIEQAPDIIEKIKNAIS